MKRSNPKGTPPAPNYFLASDFMHLHSRLIARDPNAIAQARQLIADRRLEPLQLNQINILLNQIERERAARGIVATPTPKTAAPESAPPPSVPPTFSGGVTPIIGMAPPNILSASFNDYLRSNQSTTAAPPTTAKSSRSRNVIPINVRNAPSPFSSLAPIVTMAPPNILSADFNQFLQTGRSPQLSSLMEAMVQDRLPGNPGAHEVGGDTARRMLNTPLMNRAFDQNQMLTPSAQAALDDQTALIEQGRQARRARATTSSSGTSPLLPELPPVILNNITTNPDSGRITTADFNQHLQNPRFERPLPPRAIPLEEPNAAPFLLNLNPENQRQERLRIQLNPRRNFEFSTTVTDLVNGKKGAEERLRVLLKDPWLNPSQVSMGHVLLKSQRPAVINEELYPRSSGKKNIFRGFSGKKKSQSKNDSHNEIEFDPPPFPGWGPDPFEDYKSHLSKKSLIDKLFEAANRNKWQLRRGGHISPPYYN